MITDNAFESTFKSSAPAFYTIDDAQPSWLKRISKVLASLVEHVAQTNPSECARAGRSAVAANSLLTEISNARSPEPSIVLTNRFTIQIEWHYNGQDLEIECINSTSYMVYYEYDAEEIYEEYTCSYDFRDLIYHFKQLSSELTTVNITH